MLMYLKSYIIHIDSMTNRKFVADILYSIRFSILVKTVTHDKNKNITGYKNTILQFRARKMQLI